MAADPNVAMVMQREDSSRKSAHKGRSPLGLISRRIHEGAPQRTRSYSEVPAADLCWDHIIGDFKRSLYYMLLDSRFLSHPRALPNFRSKKIALQFHRTLKLTLCVSLFDSKRSSPAARSERVLSGLLGPKAPINRPHLDPSRPHEQHQRQSLRDERHHAHEAMEDMDAARVFFVLGHVKPLQNDLINLSFIQFARWVIIPRNAFPYLGDKQQARDRFKYDYLLFFSNFNGTWNQYIDAFSAVLSQGLNLIWRWSEKFPAPSRSRPSRSTSPASSSTPTTTTPPIRRPPPTT